MPAKKTAAKKTPARRTSPAKKTTAAKPRTTRASAAAKKDLSYENIWEDDLTTQYPAMKKNNFLSLIVLWLWTLLVVVGIYIQVNKEQPATTNTNKKMTGNTAVVSTWTSQTGGAVASTGSTTQPTTTTGTFPVDAQKLVESFYDRFNNDQFDQISSMYDNNFNTVAGLRQYFSVPRLERWKENIVGDLKVFEVNAVIDHPIVQRNSNAMVVQYQTEYTLKQNGKTYSETWFAYVMRGGGTIKLNGFECQENCAASPFFQLR